MELNEALLDQINRYLSGKMEPDEQQQFEREVASTPALQQEVELQREIKTAFKMNHEINQEMAKIRAIHDQLKSEGKLWQPDDELVAKEATETLVSDPKKGVPITAAEPPMFAKEALTRRIGWSYYAMAASIVGALIIVGYYFTRRDYPSDPNKAVAKQQPPTVPGDSSSQMAKTEDSIPDEKPLAQDRPIPIPNNKQSQLASQNTTLFDTYFKPSVRQATAPEKPDDRLTGPNVNPESIERIEQDTLAIQKAIQFLKKGQTNGAILLLEPAQNTVLPMWRANARWFLALAYVKSDQADKAKPLLQKLSTKRPDLYQAEATKLLESLDAKK